ncbi:MAG: precorrin-6Y C5,15-methyltransferase (decarboxylating) subunit CbiT, partial [Sneathiella sp.]|nr:precorrin-6Y C5,15-methyltransferase (decarboxylating) subunit CbiT [Sneathiella sp.]
LDPNEMAVLPSLSAYSLAASRLGWDLSRTCCLTLHGRPIELLTPHLIPGARILALSDNGETPKKVAQLLNNAGFGNSTLTILEHMGGPTEAMVTTTANKWADKTCKDLNTLAIDCVADENAQPLSLAAGLPDDAFHHDGQLTKQEIRSATLAALAPLPGQLLWDVGAGCGSIGIEWMRLSPFNQAIAIESRSDRLDYIEKNRLKLGVPGLKIIPGKAPDGLTGLPSPDAIFMGGGLTGLDVFETCWENLKPGGCLVANTVTLEGEAKAFSLHEKYGGTLKRLNFSRAEKIGGFTSWKPYRQVTQLKLVKV